MVLACRGKVGEQSDSEVLRNEAIRGHCVCLADKEKAQALSMPTKLSFPD